MVAFGTSCTIWGSLPLQAGVWLMQYFPMLLRSTKKILPSLAMCVSSCWPLGSVGSNTNPPEAISLSFNLKLSWL